MPATTLALPCLAFLLFLPFAVCQQPDQKLRSNRSNDEPSPIESGDAILLQTFTGMFVDIMQESVLARWQQQPEWTEVQVLTLEKQGNGSINSGDTVFLRASTGKYLDVTGDQVRARWADRGSTQSFIIHRKAGQGAVLSNETVFFQASSGRYLTVEQDSITASGFMPNSWQGFRILSLPPDLLTTAAPLIASPANLSNSTATVMPGDVIFLKTCRGMLLDVEAQSVQARWTLYGTWQAFILEKAGSGPITSGDSVFLKAWSGNYLRVDGTSVIVDSGRRGFDTGFAIIKDGGGLVFSGDAVVFQALSTGKNLDMAPQGLQAQQTLLSPCTAFILEREDPAALRTGSMISLLAPSTGRRLGLQGQLVLARWAQMTPARAIFLANDENLGPWMHAFSIKGGAGRAIRSGDAVTFRAYTGNYVDAGQDGRQMYARYSEESTWQTFVIENKQGDGAILPGDAVFLRAYNGLRVTVVGTDVNALAADNGDDGLFVIEAFDGDTQRPSGQYRRTILKAMIITGFCLVLVVEFVSSAPKHKA